MIQDNLKEQKIDELFNKLEENRNNKEKTINLLTEINERIANKQFSFFPANEEKKFLYLYMYLSNKLEQTTILDTLINDPNFIKLLDTTDIDGSMLPSLTSNLKKPRKTLITKSKKIKNSLLNGDNILNAQDILADLTKEEIKLLRKDIDIDNYLITNGLSFNTLKEETKNLLLNDLNQLSIYDIKTINEFTENFKDLTFLIQDSSFLKMYLSKLDDQYYLTNHIFAFLDQNTLDDILKNDSRDQVLLHLVKDVKPELQYKLCTIPHLKELLYNCENFNILNKLPNQFISEMLITSKDLFSKRNFELLEHLNKKDITTILDKNEYYYKKLISNLTNNIDFDYEFFIKHLPSRYYFDLISNHLTSLSDKVIIKLLAIDNKTYKKILLTNKELCTKILNTSDLSNLNEIFKIGHFDNEEKVRFIKNSLKYQNVNNLINIINNLPLSYRKDLYLINSLRQKLITSNDYNLDEYMISYYLNHPEEIVSVTPSKIISILDNADYIITERVLKDKEVLIKILKDKNYYIDFINLLHKNPKLFTIISKNDNISLLTKEFISSVLPHLNALERSLLCSHDLMKQIYNDEELFKVYKSLLNNNRNLLNTLNLNFINKDTKNIKLSFLDKITKYPKIQECLLSINQKFPIFPDFINTLCYTESNLSLDSTLYECLKLIDDSANGINRKKIGNIPRIMSVIEENIFSKENVHALIEYLLYLIPRYTTKNNTLVKRPIYINTPVSYNEIANYSYNTENYLTNQMSNKKNISHIKEYFIAKHFKLSLEETKIMLKIYSINRIDSEIYQEEYTYLDNLKKIYNTDEESLINMDSKYKTYSMHDSFIIENNIKKMYGKIFNYEIRSKTYSNNPFTKVIYGKEIKIFDCPNDFLFLISDVDYQKEYQKTNSYLTAWHNTLDKLPNGISTNLISNDHLIMLNDFIFGFNGLLDEGLIKMSNHLLNEENTCDEQYMTPRELIDNSRDITNTLIISRYAIRPNYNNSNLPYLEPDYILVDKTKLDNNTYLENISRASEEFKTKRNKEGLPIIAIDFSKIVDNELRKIKQLTNKYERTHDMTILPSLITKILNNYSAYSLYNEKLTNKFNLNKIIDLITKKIEVSNSNAELNFIIETLTNEYQKYQNISKNIKCPINIKEIKDIIKKRQEIINN